MREIARQTGASTSTIQGAMQQLIGREWLRKVSGNATVKNLLIFEPEGVPVTATGVSVADTPVLSNRASQAATPVSVTDPPPVSVRATPAVSFPATLPTQPNETTQGPKAVSGSDTPVDRSIEDFNALNRVIVDWVLSIDSTDSIDNIDRETIAEARSSLHNYAKRWGPHPNPQPPDDRILAQFLAVAEWHRLFTTLRSLYREEKPCGSTYGWFVTVAMQRIHGIQPHVLHERRQELKQQRKPPERAAAAAAGSTEFKQQLINELKQSTPFHQTERQAMRVRPRKLYKLHLVDPNHIRISDPNGNTAGVIDTTDSGIKVYGNCRLTLAAGPLPEDEGATIILMHVEGIPHEA